MAIGDSGNLLSRVKGLIPGRWFAWAAQNRDAVMGGLSDLSAWCYNFIGYARLQTRLSTATDLWLDIIALDFLGRFIQRRTLDDTTFRAKIRATVLAERVTRAGMISALQTLTGNTPKIFEPWNTFDTGAWSNSAAGQNYGSMGYGVGQGGWGSMSLPCQVFIQPKRGAGSGVPNVNGWGGYQGGYGVGTIEYVDQVATFEEGITNQDINDLITHTKPTGVTAWTAIN